MNDKDLNKKLFDAAGKGNLKKVIELIEQGAHIDCRQKGDKSTPIINACLNGHLEIVVALLDRGANPYLVNEGNIGVLNRAVIANNKDIFELLVKYDDRKRNFNYDSVWLNLSAIHPNTESHNINDFSYYFDRLISLGGNINAKIDKGMTPLHLAVKHYNIEMVKMLIQHKANIHAIEFEKGMTPMLLSANIEKSYPKYKFVSPEITRLLIENGADINVRTSNQETAIMFASASVLEQMLDDGVDVNAKDIDGLSALHHQAKKGNGKEIEILLRHGANINEQNDRGETPLMTAYKFDKFETFIALLSENPDIELTNRDGDKIGDMVGIQGYMYRAPQNAEATLKEYKDVFNCHVDQLMLNQMISSEVDVTENIQF